MNLGRMDPSSQPKKKTKKDDSKFFAPEIMHHFSHYLPICLYLARMKKYGEFIPKFSEACQESIGTKFSVNSDMEKFDPEYMLKDRDFIESLIKSILKLEETTIYKFMLVKPLIFTPWSL